MTNEYFKKIKTYGSSLDSWDNMLIFGDNLVALKDLSKDKNVVAYFVIYMNINRTVIG